MTAWWYAVFVSPLTNSNLAYSISKKKVDSQNHILLDQFKLGEKVDSSPGDQTARQACHRSSEGLERGNETGNSCGRDAG
jgi:hypothetical protein